MPASGKPRGHPKEVAGKRNPALDSKKFLREFFKKPEDRPKKCDNKRVQCGLKGLARGEDFPTVDPSGAPGGAGEGGAGGAGPGAAAASVAPKGAQKETIMKFRKDLNVNQNKTAAPPKEMGSDPASMHQTFAKGEEMVEVDPSEVEVMDDSYDTDVPEMSMEPEVEDPGCACECGEDQAGFEMNDEPMEVSEDEVSFGEPSRHAYATTQRFAEDEEAGGDMGGDDGGMVEVGEADIEAAGDDLEEVGFGDADPADCSHCECTPKAGEDIPEVAEDEVEFLGEDDAVMSPKAEAMYAATLARAARRQRAAQEEPFTPSRGPSEEAPVVETSEKDSPAASLVEVLTPIESLGEVDINDVELNLFNEESENPHYTVMVKGEPVAKIALDDQTLPQDQHDLFLQADYPQFVLEGIEQFGLEDTLKSVHARYYAARAFEGDVAAAMKKSASAELEVQAKRHIAKIKDDLSNVASLVIEASLKNYIVENPLRDALVQQMRSAGVDAEAAVDLVEDAFRQAGSQYFTMILNKSEEWMGAPKEAMEHHVKEITGMNYRHPGYAVADAEDEIPEAVEPEVAPQVLTASVPRSVPLRTAAPQPQAHTAEAASFTGNWQADKAAWKQRLNLFGHVASKSLANADKIRK